MKPKGASIIIQNDMGEILLMLRDDIDGLAYRNMWDIPGGHVEKGETPYDCIKREILEEIEVVLVSPILFQVREFSNRTEYTYMEQLNLDLSTTPLHEGQRMRWFSASEALETKLAYNFNCTVQDFFHYSGNTTP